MVRCRMSGLHVVHNWRRGRQRSRPPCGTRAMADIDLERAQSLAEARFDVVTAEALSEARLCTRWAARQARRGKWQSPGRGTYVVHNRPLSDLTFAHAAAAYAGPESVVTGLLPLRMLGLRWLPAVDRAHVLVPDSVRTPSSKLIRLTRTKDLQEVERWSRAGLTLASAPRAVVDAGRHLADLRAVRGVLLGAVADGHADVDELRQMLDRGQRNGSGLVRRAIGDAERGCASPPEAELVDALIGCGMPFLVNPEVRCGDALVGFPDVLFVGRAVTGEVESVERHGSADEQESTYDRHERFVVQGLDPFHLSVRRLRADISDSAGALVARAAAAGPFPAHLTVIPRGPVLG